jgi:hypothetical protein
MADNLQFPILFDLEKGVEAAIKEWDGKYADKLEKAIQKRALNVKLKFDTKQLDSLDAVKTRLAQLKIEPITPETKSAIKELASELRTLAKALEQVQKYAKNPTKGAIDASKVQLNEQRAKAQAALAAQRAAKAEDNLAAARLKAARAANVGTSATRNANKAFAEQSSYLSRLTQRMAAYWSIRQVGNLLTNVREVTAQFELQRVSLGAILQDANKGEQIFSQIKQFALKSPISILDLTKYTKQLAAYKIGYDELFDTTKRLADVSVGLGVDFQRIVLLYGQVRATGYLRASEVRQATEAGIPLVEELAAKLTKANGELVTAADVMEMISKRAISFDMVKDVFTDMTSAGGMFYNMQEKQGNTLYGLWAKLGDAASVMYEQIGNTGVVNEGMKEAIQMLTELMRNWKAVGLTAATSILPAVAAMAAWKMATKALAKSVATATAERIAAEAKLATALEGTDVAAQNAARSTLAKAKADEAAAIAAQKNATAQSRLKMGFVSLGKTIASGLGIGIAIMLVTNLIYKFYEALTNFRKLKRELGSIYTETATLQDQSVRNFEFLADKAVKAVNGSKEQTDALQELNRTYRDILPQEALTIENLTKMKGKYDALTQSIREYVAEQQRQEAESTIYEYYGAKIKDAKEYVRESLLDYGVSANEVGRFFVEFEKVAPKYGKNTWGAFREAMIAAGVKDEVLIERLFYSKFTNITGGLFGLGDKDGGTQLANLSDAYIKQAEELKGMNEQYRESIGNLGKFADMQKRVSDAVANANYTFKGGAPVDRETQGDILDAMKLNLWVKQTAFEIQNNEDIKKAFAYMGEGIKSEWFSIINMISSNDLGKVSQINFDAIIASVDNMIAKLGNKNPEILAILNTLRNYLVAQKKEYENMVPSKAIVVRWQTTWRQIVKELKISGQNMNQYLMGSAEDFETYRKRIKDEVAAVIKTIALLQDAIAKNKKTGKRTKEQQAQDEKELKQAQERKVALEKLLADLDKIEIETGKKKKGPKGSKSDTRLQVLQEVAQTLTTINKEYDDLEKKEGSPKALADIKERFKDVLSYANKLGGKFGLNFGFPTEFKTLQEYRNAILKVMQSLKGLPKGSEKTILDFKTMIGKADSDYLQKQIESELKRLADRISRTKTAKEFYEKILGQTGNRGMAKRLVTSIFGENGSALNKEIAERMRKMVDGTSATLPDFVFNADMSVNSKALRGWVEANKAALGDVAKELTKFADDAEKDTAKMVEGWLKATEKAKTYGDKLADVYRTTATEIARIEAEMAKGNLGRDIGTELIAGYRRKEAEEVAKLQYEAFKDSPMYVQMFDDLDHASTRMLENMKSRLENLQGAWRNLDPTQLKEMQSRLSEIDEQLAKRNPFKVMADGLREYTRLRTKGDARGNTSRANADRDATEWADKYLEAQEELAKITSDPTATEAQIAGARQMVDYTKRQKDEAEKTAANWKKVEDAIGLSANQLMQMLNWGGDIAHAIADISEAMGADEEDVQYWNDIASGLDEVSGAIQDIVSAAMSANVVGVISSALTAIPKMFVGFANIFSAGKVKRANKEIKRQQELIEALEYSYSRLEKAAEKTFGADYLRNVNERLRMLKAEAEAYRKQAEAERSKGKKRDKEAEKEYLEHARDTADEIEELNRGLQEKITGTTVEKAAEDFANAWLDAYLSFGNTAEAIKEKFRDMMKTMVVNMALSGVVERMLKPLMDMIDERAADGELSSREIAEIMGAVPGYVDDIDNAMTVAMEALKAAGVDVGQLRDAADAETRGIAKGVASATSEEINAATAVGKTLLYYASPIPRIDENLARVVSLIESRGASAMSQTASAGWTDWQQQAMDNYQAIARNTANTVIECRRAADACEKLSRAVKSKGSTTGINTFLNS